MTRKAGIEITADERDAVRGFRVTRAAAGELGQGYKSLAIDADKSAKAQVAASVKKDARIREEIKSYKSIAKAAQSGSKEEVTANNLAAQSEARLARSLSVTSRESRELASSSSKAGREISSFARGSLAGSGAARSLGRSLAFAGAGFLSAAALVSGVKQAIGAASDLTEQIDKSNVVFRGSEGQVQHWSKTLADSFGITRGEALATGSTFGNLLVPMGFARRDAAKLSERLVELGGDIASFNNADPTEVLDALRSGLAGQVRPLRQFGVFLNQDRIAAEALADGIVKSNVSVSKIREANDGLAVARARLTAANAKYGAGSVQATDADKGLSAAERALQRALGGTAPKLTQAQKTLAIYRIILKDTADAHGDAARTSGTLAGQLRREHAIVGNLREEIGQKLTPYVIKYLGELNDWLGKSENQQKITKAVDTVVHDLSATVKALAPIVEDAAKVAGDFSGAVGGAGNAVKILALTIGTVKLLKLADGFGGISGGAKTAGKEVGLLRSRLLALRGLGTIGLTIAIAVVVADAGKRFSKFLGGTKIGQELGLGDHELSRAQALDLLTKNEATPEQLEKAAGSGLIKREDLAAALATFRRRQAKALAAGGGLLGGASGLIKSVAAGLGDVVKGAPVAASSTTGGGGAGSTSTGPRKLTRAETLALGLAASPNNLALLRTQAANQSSAIADLKKRYADGKVASKDYVATLTTLLDDRRQTDEQIASIEQAAAQKAASAAAKRTAAAKRAAAARARAAAAALRAYVHGVAAEAAELKNAASSSVRAAGSRAGSAIAATGSTPADDRLIQFYKKEAHDSKLTREQRAHYAKLALDEEARGVAAEAAELKNAASSSRATIRQTNAGATVIGAVAEQRADDRLIAFYKREAKDSRLTREQRAHYAKLAIDERHRETTEAARQAATIKKARDRVQFRALGLGPTGGELDPTVKALRAEATHVSTALKGTFLDTSGNAKLMKGVRRVLAGQLGSLSTEMRSKVKELLDGLKGQLNEFDGFNLTAAEKRRRSLDRSLADTYNRRARSGARASSRAGSALSGAGVDRVVHFSPTIQAVTDEPIRKTLDRAYFRMRVQTGAGK